MLRPSQNLKIARIEKNLKKISAIHKLGIDDCTANIEKIKTVFNKLDDKEIIHNIEEDDDNNIKVYIGNENKIDEDVTVIKTKFKKGNEEGTIAIIGPKRMDYERVVGMLEYMKENIER